MGYERIQTGMVFRCRHVEEELFTILEVEDDWFSYMACGKPLVRHRSFMTCEFSSDFLLLNSWVLSYTLLE